MGIYVTGVGVVSGLGVGVEENLRAIREGRNGMGKISLFRSAIDVPVSEVKYTNGELRSLLDIPEDIPMSRTALLGIMAAGEALTDSGVSIEECAECGLKVGLISSTSVGGMDRSEVFYNEFRQDPSKGDDRDIITHDCGESTESIAAWLGITGFRTTISTACSSAANAIIVGAEMIKSGMLDIVIAGGTDALCKFTLNGFNSLMILDKEHCRPFDKSRAGLNLGEGAGYLVLQSEKSFMGQQKDLALQPSAEILNTGDISNSEDGSEHKWRRTPYAYLSGYSNANDAYHQTASSPDGTGAYLCMTKAIEMAGIAPEDIGFVNAHGTGTANNDLSESRAMERVFGSKIPPFSSLKGYIGHTLGASEGIEAALSVAALSRKEQLPSLNFTDPIEETSFIPVTIRCEESNMEHLISNAFGFGGNNSSLLFSSLSGAVCCKESDNVDEMLYVLKNKRQNRYYIKNFAAISPYSDDADRSAVSNSALKDSEDRLFKAIEPDYKTIITDANLRRRMSRLVKMGVAAGLESLRGEKQRGLPDNIQSVSDCSDSETVNSGRHGGLKIDAIITATGFGLLADTGKFIDSIIDNGEQMLNPVPFIQSTFNTVGAQIALLTGNHAYNNTYVHRFVSFESALTDAIINLDRDAENVLVGAFDEITDVSVSILRRLRLREKIGEGASFLILGRDSEDAIAEIVAVEIFYEGLAGIENRVKEICLERGLEIGVIIAAKRGCGLFPETPHIVYEDMCGEYHTESAFALGTVLESLSSGQGDISRLTMEQNQAETQKSGVLIYNNYSDYCQSIIIVNSMQRNDATQEL